MTRREELLALAGKAWGVIVGCAAMWLAFDVAALGFEQSNSSLLAAAGCCLLVGLEYIERALAEQAQ